MERASAAAEAQHVGRAINPCGKIPPLHCTRYSSELPVMSPPERPNVDPKAATAPLIRGVFYWTLTESFAGPYQIGSVEWPARGGGEPVVMALDGQRFSIDDALPN